MTCRHFAHGTDAHGADAQCHVLLGCNIRQMQVQHGDHLKKRCQLWAPSWQKDMGWAPEAGYVLVLP